MPGSKVPRHMSMPAWPAMSATVVRVRSCCPDSTGCSACRVSWPRRQEATSRCAAGMRWTDDVRPGGRGYQHDFRGAAGRAQRLDADGAMSRYRFGQRPRQGVA